MRVEDVLEKLCMCNDAIAILFRRAIRDSKYFRFRTLVKCGATARPAYAYGVYYAAYLAKLAGLSKCSVIELGVAGGNGLLAMERYARRVEQEIGIEIEVYGFDSGGGLPVLASLYDLPYWFKQSLYTMDYDKLSKKLLKAKLVIGNVKDTVQTFFEKYKPSPIGFVANDLDLYTSTVDSFCLIDGPDEFFLPRFIYYMDDIIGSIEEMYCDGVGELRAINEFNKSRENIGIWPNNNLKKCSHLVWPCQIYYGHRFSHPEYSKFVSGQTQKIFEHALKLR